jgi:hypothetical protein
MHVLTTAMELNLSSACRRARWERFGLHDLDPANATSLDLYPFSADIDATFHDLTQDS